jgi:signal transduction histidine kinase
VDIDKNLELDSYPGAWSQVLTNLVLNSFVHGFGDREVGKIQISGISKNDSISVKYSDNGKGINKENLNKIFDPFFTTDKNLGTGLGLHIVYNLVTQKLNGQIICESKQNEGTSFILDIPATS